MGKKKDKTKRKWSKHVAKTSDVPDLEKDTVKRGGAQQIAVSLKGSAERSDHRKSGPFRSAMSMLTSYINRAGRNLAQRRRGALADAKGALRKDFGRKAGK